MCAFTLRIEPDLARKLDKVCKQQGYNKTGLVKSLIRDFLERQFQTPTKPLKKSGLESMIGIVSLGGDAVKDSENYFE